MFGIVKDDSLLQALVASTPLATFFLTYTLYNSGDSQSFRRAWLRREQAVPGPSGRIEEVPTTYRRPLDGRERGLWAATVPKGMPEEAFEVRSLSSLMLMSSSTAGAILAFVFTANPFWLIGLLANTLAAGPLVLMLLRRRARFAGEVYAVDDTVVVQIIDPIAPMIVGIDSGTLLTSKAVTWKGGTWRVTRCPHQPRCLLVLRLRPRGHTSAASVLDSRAWSRVVWLGLLPTGSLP